MKQDPKQRRLIKYPLCSMHLAQMKREAHLLDSIVSADIYRIKTPTEECYWCKEVYQEWPHESM